MHLLLALMIACTGPKEGDTVSLNPSPLSKAAYEAFSPERMRATVDFLADEALGGRIPGSVGHDEAMVWILDEMSAMGLEGIGLEGDFVYPYANEPTSDRFQLQADGSVVVNEVSVGYDLVGRIPGSDPALADEHILVMAHYDHLGVTAEGDAYNGAFDNASGVAVALELARVLIAEDAAPGRSVIILLTDDEEAGLDGAREWLSDPTVPKEQIVYGLSIDPVGRPTLPDYWPTLLIGLEHSDELNTAWRSASQWSDNPVVYIHREMVPVFASDQDELYRADPAIPGFWMVNPGFSFYHTPDDTPETVDYRVLLDDVRFVATALTATGADDERYSFEPEPTMAGDAARDVRALFEGLLKSEYLTKSERDYSEWFMGELDKIIREDNMEAVPNAEALILAGEYFVLFELGESHPGTIPPPFPE